MGFALSLVPLVVAGQLFGTVNLTVNDQTDVSINGGSCGAQITGNVTTQIRAATICSALQMWVTDGECTDAPNTTNDLVLTEISQQTLLLNRNQNQPLTFAVNSMPYFRKQTADGGAGCGGADLDIAHKLCASVTVANDISCFSKSVLKATTPVTIRYDTLAPAPPVVSGAEPFDGAAAVSVSASDSDTASIQIQKKGPDDADFVTVTTVTTGGSTTIMNLTNGVTYEIRAIALDAVMPTPNASGPSEVVTVTPRQSAGFWDSCREAGCDAGCNAAAAGPLGLAALALLMLVRRMRR